MTDFDISTGWGVFTFDLTSCVLVHTTLQSTVDLVALGELLVRASPINIALGAGQITLDRVPTRTAFYGVVAVIARVASWTQQLNTHTREGVISSVNIGNATLGTVLAGLACWAVLAAATTAT